MNDKLKGKVAIVTGATSGIGRATARLLAEYSVSLALVGRSNNKLDALSNELGENALALPTDLSIAGEVDSMVASVLDRFGKIDILLANAGMFATGEAIIEDPDMWDKLLAVNINSVFRATRRVLPEMIKNQSGDIIITSSIAGHRIMQNEPVYSASKHAVQAFAHSIRTQVARHNIRVGAISPGTVLNELWGYTGEAEINQQVERHMGIRSEDVAEAIVFMLTRPAHVTIGDLMILPQRQEI